uniref:Uncharacterized protein n=1 Tax=Trypanosoma congolense (strain IL3000) TaxID=1068625 RepID=G0UZT5_TRYCI|nr:conserved hypothetical protein [Trypanosoma congolense IL3000]
MSVTADFTREDEYQLEALRASKDCGDLSQSERETLDRLERKYDAFIKKSLHNMKSMGSERLKRGPWLLRVLLSWPFLWVSLSLFFFVFLLVINAQVMPVTHTVLRWHFASTVLLLFPATLLAFTRFSSWRSFELIALLSFVVVGGVLGLVVLLTVPYIWHQTDQLQDVRILIMNVLYDIVLVLIPALMLARLEPKAS